MSKLSASIQALIATVHAIPTPQESAAALLAAKDAQIAQRDAQIADLQRRLNEAVTDLAEEDADDLDAIAQINHELAMFIAESQALAAQNAEAAPALALAVATTPDAANDAGTESDAEAGINAANPNPPYSEATMASQTDILSLDIAEQQAINQFLQDHWGAFERAAKDFLSEEEIEALGDKLSDFG